LDIGGTEVIDSSRNINNIGTISTGTYTLTIDETASLSSYLTNVVDDTSPQLGGNLDTAGYDIVLADGDKIQLTTKLSMYRDNSYFGESYVVYDNSSGGSYMMCFTNSLVIYGNCLTDASGMWEPSFMISKDGRVEIINIDQGDSGNRVLDLRFADGIKIANDWTSPFAILKVDNIATSDKIFQFPNESGTFALTTDVATKTDKNLSIISKSTTYTVAAADNNKVIHCDGTFTITLPDGLDTGYNVTVVNVGTGTITLSATTTLNTKDSAVTLPNQYGAATIYHAGSNVWYAYGDLE